MATETKQVTRECTFRLSEHEIVGLAKKAADVRLARAAIQVEFARTKSAFKGRIEEKENELSTILQTISEGKEKRVVSVTDVYDFNEGVVDRVLRDAGDGVVAGIDFDKHVVIAEQVADGAGGLVTQLVVETFHVSSDDPIESRVMSVEERQVSLPFKPKAQGDLPLGEPAASPTAQTDASLGEAFLKGQEVEPWRTELPDPTTEGQEVYVTGEPDRPTMVRHLAATWRLEAGEGRRFVATSRDVFGAATLVWISDEPEAATAGIPAGVMVDDTDAPPAE